MTGERLNEGLPQDSLSPIERYEYEMDPAAWHAKQPQPKKEGSKETKMNDSKDSE